MTAAREQYHGYYLHYETYVSSAGHLDFQVACAGDVVYARCCTTRAALGWLCQLLRWGDSDADCRPCLPDVFLLHPSPSTAQAEREVVDGDGATMLNNQITCRIL